MGDSRMNRHYVVRVEQGVKLLDRSCPGWEDRISQDAIAMETCDRCILGSLYGDYFVGWHEVLKPFPASVLFRSAGFGFTLYSHEQDTSSDTKEVILNRFRELADVWRDVIRKRKDGIHD
jgi:hypothetical protein